MPWRKNQQPTPVLLPGKSHGQRSLVGYSPWGQTQLSDWAYTHIHTEYLIQWKCYANSCKNNENTMYIVTKLCFLELSGIFSSKYFWSEVSWVLGCGTCGYGGLTIKCLIKIDLVAFFTLLMTYTQPWSLISTLVLELIACRILFL